MRNRGIIWRIWLAIYSRYMRRRGFSMTYTQGGVHFEGVGPRCRAAIDNPSWIDRLHELLARRMAAD